MLHEEVDAGFLELDGEGGFVGDALGDGDVVDVELEAGGGAGVGADAAGDDEGGLEGEGLEGLEYALGDGGFGDDALDGSGAVAEGGEEQLAGGAEVVEPAAQGDGLAFVLADFGDGGDGSGGRGWWRGWSRHEDSSLRGRGCLAALAWRSVGGIGATTDDGSG